MDRVHLGELRGRGAPLDGGVPDGDPATAWERRLLDYRLVSPLNRGKFTVIVVGTGLAGAGCAAALGELGYRVESFTFHDAPRRAHSVAAQGGINAARGRKVDNDSVGCAMYAWGLALIRSRNASICAVVDAGPTSIP